MTVTDSTIYPKNVTVKELIKLLEKFDPEARVLVDQGLCRPPIVAAFNGRTDVVLIGTMH